jgi:TPR repeat protein
VAETRLHGQSKGAAADQPIICRRKIRGGHGLAPRRVEPVVVAADQPFTERSGVRGDYGDRFVDLALPAGTKIDRESPVLIRTAFSDIHEVTFLISDPRSTRAVETVAFDRRLLPVGDETLVRAAAQKDPSALYAVGRFLLWDLDDPGSALPYLQTAAIRGNVEAAIDLLTIALFPRF